MLLYLIPNGYYPPQIFSVNQVCLLSWSGCQKWQLASRLKGQCQRRWNMLFELLRLVILFLINCCRSWKVQKVWKQAIVADKYAEMLQTPAVPRAHSKLLAVIFILKKCRINSWWSISLSKIIGMKVGYIDYCMLKWLIKVLWVFGLILVSQHYKSGTTPLTLIDWHWFKLAWMRENTIVKA